jgi:hypothetical protein
MESEVNKSKTTLTEDEDYSRHCPACGADAREQARFCATCGRALEGSYFPTDALRSSYHQQEEFEKQLRGKTKPVRDEKKEAAKVSGNLFSTENNSVAKMALAFATYALVPYLGILFCPCAVLLGGFGFIRSYRFPKLDGRRASLASIILGVVILFAQIILWWLLYVIADLRLPIAD